MSCKKCATCKNTNHGQLMLDDYVNEVKTKYGKRRLDKALFIQWLNGYDRRGGSPSAFRTVLDAITGSTTYNQMMQTVVSSREVEPANAILYRNLLRGMVEDIDLQLEK